MQEQFWFHLVTSDQVELLEHRSVVLWDVLGSDHKEVEFLQWDLGTLSLAVEVVEVFPNQDENGREVPDLSPYTEFRQHNQVHFVLP